MRATSTGLAIVVALLLCAAPFAVQGQQPAKMYRIGILSAADFPPAQGFREGLRDYGWAEGHTIAIDWRPSSGASDRLLDALVTELVRAGVDVIIAGSTPATLAAKRATQTVPIVFVGIVRPVERGVVTSLARPGGNVTGVAASPEQALKRFQLLKEAAPRVARLVYLEDPRADLPAHGRDARRQAIASDARKLGLDVRWVDVGNPTEIDAALAELAWTEVNGLHVSDTATLFGRRERICTFARDNKFPAVSRTSEFAEAGCLMTYGPNLTSNWRRAAWYVDRILRGAKAADLPVEQAANLELVINLKTAKALGLTIAPALLLRADRVIE